MNKNWIESTLSLCCDFENGDRGQNYPSRADFVDKGYLFVNAGHLENKRIQMDSMNFISEEVFKSLSRGKFAKGHLLFCLRGSLGKYAIVNNEGEGAIASSLVIVKPKQTVTSDFIGYYFDSELCSKMIMKYAGGAAQPNLGAQDLKKFNISIPPLQEQQQIVAILDEAFAAINQAKVNIEKNIQNAREVFQSKLNAIFSQKGDGWEIKPLSNVCSILNGYAFKSKDTVEKSNTQVLRMGNLYQNKLDLDRNPVFYPEHFKNNHKDFLLKDGDLVMSLTGTVDKTDYGYTVKIKCSGRNLLLNQRIMKIDVRDEEIMNKDYLRNFLLSPEFLVKLYSTASGTRQANLSSSAIMKLNINFPKDTGIQEKIVSIIDTLSEKTIEIESLYRNKLNQLEELKKSLLRKAFSGELKLQKVDAA